MKNGFTIVELAIVLVVIGIVLSMGLKGKQLVEAAKMNAEVSKVHKIQSATAIYMSKKNMNYFNGFFLASMSVGFQGITLDIFVNEGLLTEKDVKTDLLVPVNKSAANYRPYGLGLFGCDRNKISDTVSVWNATAQTQTNLCLTSTYFWENHSSGGIAYVDTSSPRYVCAIETILDDRNELGGMGMAWSAASYAFGLIDEDFDNCLDLSTNVTSGKYYLYGLM